VCLQSVVNFPTNKDLSAYQVLRVPLEDSEVADLLSHLPKAYSFINDGTCKALGFNPQEASPVARSEASHSFGSECL